MRRLNTPSPQVQLLVTCAWPECGRSVIAPYLQHLTTWGWHRQRATGLWVCQEHPYSRHGSPRPPRLIRDYRPIIEAYQAIKNMRAVGDQFGISRERVRQIVTKASNGSPVAQAIEVRQQYVLDHHGDMTSREIAERLGVSYFVIQHDAWILGVHCVQPWERRPTREQVTAVYDGSLAHVAEHFGLTRGQAQYLLAKYGLRSRRMRGSVVDKVAAQREADKRWRAKRAMRLATVMP